MSRLTEALSSKSILIVDDKHNNLQLLVKYLDNTDYEISIAQNGTRAISIATTLQPDLILLDIMMPQISGFDVCRHLKNEPKTKDIPIIFMTALDRSADKVKGLNMGAVDYITKPFHAEELLSRIQTHLSLNHLYQQSVQSAARRKSILEISDRIRQSLHLKTILTTATQEIRELLDCEFVGIAEASEREITLKAHTSLKKLDIGSKASIPNEYFRPEDNYYQSYLADKIVSIDNSISTTFLPAKRLIMPILIKNINQKFDFFSTKKDLNTKDYLYGWLIIAMGDCTVAQPADRNSLWQAETTALLKELIPHLARGIEQGLLYRQLSQLALLDSLTRVYNRRAFERQLKQEWGRLQRISASLSLIMCDVDCFKIYNDTYGHQEGDKCLQQVTKAISSTLKRSADFVARYGGEEFVIVLPNTPQNGAYQVGENIRQAVKKLQIPHHNSSVDSVVTVSLGVASTVPNTTDRPQLLVEAADLALYKAKAMGRDCIAIYPESISRSKDRQELKLRWVKRLRQALKNNLFSLYAQSITPLKGKDSGKYFEILLRLTDSGNKIILPGAFIDIAERNHLMTDIDTWVINNLLSTLEQLDSTNNLNNCRFSVNLSGASLNQESFLDFLQQRLKASHLSPELFCFEITESVAVVDINKVNSFIYCLKDLGCSFALDDFGKGVSSLTYLKNLPVDYLKIDGSFITELDVNPASKVMVEAINHIAEGIGLKTVAEFVENEAILNSVRDLNVDYAQGFHFGRPKALVDAIV